MGWAERTMLGNQFEGENHAARRYVKMCTVSTKEMNGYLHVASTASTPRR